jgi:hypothetical protein
VPHGEITDLGDAFGMDILAFRDPDNIQLELFFDPSTPPA